MCATGIIILYRRFGIPTHGSNDIAFCNDFDLVAQGRTTQRVSKHLLGRIAAIDVGLIHRGDTLIQTGGHLIAHMFRAGIGVISQTPHAIHKTRKAERSS